MFYKFFFESLKLTVMTSLITTNDENSISDQYLLPEW